MDGETEARIAISTHTLSCVEALSESYIFKKAAGKKEEGTRYAVLSKLLVFKGTEVFFFLNRAWLISFLASLAERGLPAPSVLVAPWDLYLFF